MSSIQIDDIELESRYDDDKIHYKITKNTNILPRKVFDYSGNFHCVIFVEQKGMVVQCEILIFPLIYL